MGVFKATFLFLHNKHIRYNQDCDVPLACSTLILNYHTTIRCLWILFQIGEKSKLHTELMDTQYENLVFTFTKNEIM